MTLSRRDEFAKAAMHALLSNPNYRNEEWPKETAKASRNHADYLIKELDKTPSPKA